MESMCPWWQVDQTLVCVELHGLINTPNPKPCLLSLKQTSWQQYVYLDKLLCHFRQLDCPLFDRLHRLPFWRDVILVDEVLDRHIAIRKSPCKMVHLIVKAILFRFDSSARTTKSCYSTGKILSSWNHWLVWREFDFVFIQNGGLLESLFEIGFSWIDLTFKWTNFGAPATLDNLNFLFEKVLVAHTGGFLEIFFVDPQVVTPLLALDLVLWKGEKAVAGPKLADNAHSHDFGNQFLKDFSPEKDTTDGEVTKSKQSFLKKQTCFGSYFTKKCHMHNSKKTTTSTKTSNLW